MSYLLREACLDDVERVFAIRLEAKENIMNREEINVIEITKALIMKVKGLDHVYLK